MNKDRKTTEYVEKLKDIKLSASSRARIETALMEYAQFHRVRVGDASRSIEQVPQRTSLFAAFKQLKSMTAFMIAIALIAGGGTAYAAEGAVPGDTLYVVKTDVNENIKSAFAVSNKSEAQLQARLAEERLAEAEELAARGELTVALATTIDTRLKAHYQDAEARSNTAEAAGDYETSATVRASLEGALRVHADVLADLNVRVTGNEGAALITNIRAYADAAARAQVNATATIETAVSVKATTEATIKQTDTVISNLSAKVAQAETKVSVEVYTQLEVRLSQIVATQAEAKVAFESESYKEAYASTQIAMRMAKETETMLESTLRLQVGGDVHVNTVIDNVLEVDAGVGARTDEHTDTQTKSSVDDTSDTSQSTDVELDATTNTDVELGVVDVEVQTDTSVRSGLNL